jgi:copper homeostasis protein
MMPWLSTPARDMGKIDCRLGANPKSRMDAVIMDVEICVDSVESAIGSASGGAERVELCSALSEGGITPSSGLIREVRASVTIQLFVIIRPRGGNFVYSDHELDVMRKDILESKALGVDGVVLGALTKDEEVDQPRTRELIELARPLQVTFHRAFDLCRDMDRALEGVIASGADRILTSGGKSDAVSGMTTIATLRQRAGHRIRIMAGGGIRASNVRSIALHTGVREVHTSLSSDMTKGDGGMEFHWFGGGSTPFVVTERDVRAFKSALLTVDAEKAGAAPNR